MTIKPTNKKIYRAGAQGGRGVIDIGKDNIGKRYTRTIWKDGTTIVYKEVTTDGE